MRCIHGLLLSVPETIEDVPAFKRLWLHETIRVFSDPLPHCQSATLVSQYVQEVCEERLDTTVEYLLAQLDMGEPTDTPVEMTINSIFFCDFSDPKSDSRSYVEVFFIISYMDDFDVTFWWIFGQISEDF